MKSSDIEQRWRAAKLNDAYRSIEAYLYWISMKGLYMLTSKMFKKRITQEKQKTKQKPYTGFVNPERACKSTLIGWFLHTFLYLIQ